MNVITISRQFGSGGRELGKILAEKLNYDYYDSEIIAFLSDAAKCDKDYVEEVLLNHEWGSIPLSTRNSFNRYNYDYTRYLVEEKKILEKIAASGNNFIVVGKNADVFLREYNPYKIFVCAEMKYRVKRCIERTNPDEELNEKKALKMIKNIDRSRAQTRELIANGEWGDPSIYDLCINTTDEDLNFIADELVALIKERVARGN